MPELSKNVLRRGREEPPPRGRRLRAGPLTMLYRRADLRYVCLGDREVLRRIYVAVRDEHWGTVPFSIRNESIEADGRSFRVGFDARHARGDVDFAWHGTIRGEPDGSVEFRMDGEARSDFASTRIGFCVLHPVRECAGESCTVEHTDGTLEEGAFPYWIAPHQPFLDIRAVRHQVGDAGADGVEAEVRLEGDVFEMEDQRNWTDESYKTYSRPLRLPYPFEVEEGESFAQTVTLRLHGAAEAVEEPDRYLALRLGEAAGPVPRIGLCARESGRMPTDRETVRLRGLNLSHLRADVRPASGNWRERLSNAGRRAGALDVPLQVALHLSEDSEEELGQVTALLEDLRPEIGGWLILAAEAPCPPVDRVRAARERLRAWGREAAFGVGTADGFVELNRNRPPVEEADVVAFGLSPQVHAFDDRSVMETLEGQRWVLKSARRIGEPARPAVGPITLHPPGGAGGPAGASVPPDERQASLFGAAWTVGSLKQMLEGGVHSATYYRTSGWAGVMAAEDGPPEPFPPVGGCVFPVYHVFADLGEFADGRVVETETSDPLRLSGFAVRRGRTTRVVLANLTGETQQVALQGVAGRAEVRLMDENNAETAMREPEAFRGGRPLPVEVPRGRLEVQLPPYALARVDTTEEAEG
ncbi:MAG: hypothetical protein ACOC7T_01335 [Planctomycetota bacterium]